MLANSARDGSPWTQAELDRAHGIVRKIYSPFDSSVPVCEMVLIPGSGGFGEVIFQGGPMSGIIFFIAVFIGSPAAALYGLAASIFSAEISNLFGEPVEQIHMGLFGFNAVLTAIVFAGTKRIDGFWVLLGVFITEMF